MEINAANLDLLTRGFKAAFKEAYKDAKPSYNRVTMTVTSNTGENVYAWMGQFPGMREWLGDRHILQLEKHGFAIKNRLFESTVTIPRVEIEDDQYGVYSPIFSEMGNAAAIHPDELVFSLLAQGFSTSCYDGQNFFDTDHPVMDREGNAVSTVSNVMAGDATPWFLLDTSRHIKPLIWQERMPYDLQALSNAKSDDVFHKDKYTYGVRGRANAGFGLWQMAFACKTPLTADNFKKARSDMAKLKGDRGRPMGIRPTVVVVPPALEEEALHLFKASQKDGTSNIWEGAAEIVVSPYLDEAFAQEAA